MAERRGRGGETARAEIVRRPAGRLKGLPAGYPDLLDDLKRRIRAAQVKAALAVNRELIALYWHIGKSIVERQRVEGWGKAVVDRLAGDLQHEFPGVGGFSPQNIWYMRAFYLAWTDAIRSLQQAVGEPAQPILQQAVGELEGEFLPQPVAEIPWGHNIQLITKLKDPLQRLWYATKTVEYG